MVNENGLVGNDFKVFNDSLIKANKQQLTAMQQSIDSQIQLSGLK